MNNVQKGNKFEERAIEIVYKALCSGDLGINEEYAEVFKKKKYPSTLRNGFIEFDISIEVKPPNASQYTLLYLIECKSYSSRIPVDEVETFHSQINQIGKYNIKGVFITDAPLQKGGEQLLKNLGIMHIQADMNGLYDIVFYREKSRGTGSSNIPFTIRSGELSVIQNQIASAIDKRIFSAFSKHISENRVSYGLDTLSKKDIRDIADGILEEINPELIKRARVLTIEELTSFINERYGIVINETRSSKILGKCDIKEKRISLHHELYKRRRQKFVLAHEFGHFIIHSKLRIGNTQLDVCEDDEQDFKVSRKKLSTPKDWIEWQANYFAQSLILQDNTFKVHLWKTIKRVYGLREVTSPIIVNDNPESYNKLEEVVESMSYIFNVAKTSIYIKIREIEMVKNHSRTQKISDIMNEAFDSFID